MERQEQRMEEEQVRNLTTSALLRHALEESRLLVKAEILHAKYELREELKAAQSAGILLGAGLVLALCGLSALVLALALALPLAPWLGALIVGVLIVLVAGGLVAAGYAKVPKRPFGHTRERLKADVLRTKEEVMQ